MSDEIAPRRTAPQSGSAQTSAAAKRVRSSADRQRRDRYSIAARWAGLTMDGREGKFLAGVRADLMRHVGGAPSTTQRVLIERAAMLTLQLARMDAKALAAGEMSEHASRQYLAWSGALARTIRILGLAPAPGRPPTVAEVIAQHRRPSAP